MPSPSTLARSLPYAVGGCVVVGCALRLTALDLNSLWFDEAGSLHVATAPDFIAMVATDRHPPVFFWILRHWTRVIGDSEAALRLLPALASCAALALFSMLCVRRCTGAHALLASALLALSPFSIWFAQELRAYSFLELAGVLGLVAVGLATRASPDNRLVFGVAALATAFGTGSHYLGAVLVPALSGVAADGWRRRQIAARSALALGAGAVTGLVVWAPWLVWMLPRQSATSWPPIAHLAPRDLLEFPVRLFVVEPSVLVGPLRWLVYGVGACLYASLGFALWFEFRRRASFTRPALLFAASGIAAVLLLALTIAPHFLPRYLAACAPALVLSVAGGVVACPSRVGRMLASTVMLAGAIALVRGHRSAALKQDFRAACGQVEARWQPGDRVMQITGTKPGYSEAAARYYLRCRPDIESSILSETAIPELIAGSAPGMRLHIVIFDAAYTEGAFDALARISHELFESPSSVNVRYVLMRIRGPNEPADDGR